MPTTSQAIEGQQPSEDGVTLASGPKKRGRKPKPKTNIEKPPPKKRGRKPNGGKAKKLSD